MPDRTVPYPAFNFIVNIGQGEAFGGFSDVSGLQTELTVAEYRSGNEKLNHVRKVQGVHKVGDGTLKRSVVKSKDMGDWIQAFLIPGPASKPERSITNAD